MFQSVRIASVDRPEVIVVGKFAEADPAGAYRRHALSGAIRAAASRPECMGDAGKMGEAFDEKSGTRVICVGLGKKKKFEAGDLRTVIGAVGRRLATVKAQKVRLDLGPALAEAGADEALAGRASGEALGLLSWNNLAFKGKAGSAASSPKRLALTAGADGKAFARGMALGVGLAESTNLTRTLSETPPNIATPKWIADQARKLASKTGLKCRVFAGADLERERFTGLINVGKASENKPCMIRLEYTPKGGGKRGGADPVVLIGKTMTYDTGGLSLKINNGMVGMKRDKDGGCAVFGAMHAIATTIKPSRRVVALLAVAENSISDEAYRPDDIITYRNGVTVEVTNTDAEGRLVLADALCWACEKESPASIIDLATLTGGVVVALGSTYCGMFCEDDDLRSRIERASRVSGERVWRLPMHAEYRDLMKSPVADILNSNPNRKAHPIQGAAFLSYFVDEKVPWCHLDIAGVHAVESDCGPFVKGPTGWGVRLLADLLAGE